MRGERVQGSLLKIIPMRAGPSPNPPTSSPFDSPSIKRGLFDPPWIQLEIKIIPACPRRFPTLSRAFVIIEFRDMLIKSIRSRDRGQCTEVGSRARAFLSHSPRAAVRRLSSLWRTALRCCHAAAAAARSLRIALTNAYETSIASHYSPARSPSALDETRDGEVEAVTPRSCARYSADYERRAYLTIVCSLIWKSEFAGSNFFFIS